MYRYLLLACLAAGCSSPDDDGGGGAPLPDTGRLDTGAVDATGVVDAMPDSTPDMLAAIADMMPTPVDAMMPDMGPAVPIGVAVGQRAPNFVLQDADGQDVAFADFAGQPVLVVGASSW